MVLKRKAKRVIFPKHFTNMAFPTSATYLDNGQRFLVVRPAQIRGQVKFGWHYDREFPFQPGHLYYQVRNSVA
jgi:hypothetical protein